MSSADAPEDNTVSHAKPGPLTLKGYPATITFTAKGTLQAAAASAQMMLAINDPQTPDMTEAMTIFIKEARKKDEVHVKITMISETITFETIGLDTGVLSEADAKVTLDQYFEHKAVRRAVWRGIWIAAVPSLLLAIGALITMLWLE